jgi:hypothetical protein
MKTPNFKYYWESGTINNRNVVEANVRTGQSKRWYFGRNEPIVETMFNSAEWEDMASDRSPNRFVFNITRNQARLFFKNGTVPVLKA